MVPGDAIELDEVAEPEILDPRFVEGKHSAQLTVPGIFHIKARRDGFVNRHSVAGAGALQLLWRIC
jgi:hypothetical protein